MRNGKKHLCNEGERKVLGCREKLDKESIFEEWMKERVGKTELRKERVLAVVKRG
jgi:hypothetical protein